MNNNVVAEKLNQVLSLVNEITKLIKDEAIEKSETTGTDTCDKNCLVKTITSTVRICFLQNKENQILVDDKSRVLNNQYLVDIGKEAGYNDLPNAFVSTLAAKLSSSPADLSATPEHEYAVLVSGIKDRESAIAAICSAIGQMVESFNDSIKRSNYMLEVQYEIC